MIDIHSYKLARKQDVTKIELKIWSKTCFGLVKERIKALELNLAEIQGAEPTKEYEAALSLELVK